jgi:hypothetical protein
MADPHLDRLLGELWPMARDRSSGDVYALLDAARDPRIARLLKRSMIDYCCLYSGKLPRELEDAAPYLVSLGRNSRLTAELITLGWGNSCGFFVSSRALLQDLRRHFRRFLLVQDDGGRRLVFRFYDPRVLRTYLPTCNAGELRQFFGPVERYVVEGDPAGSLIEYRCTGAGLLQEVVDLARDPGPGRAGPGERDARWPSDGWRPSVDATHPLKIRAEQMEVFQRRAEEAFVRRVVQHLRSEHAKAIERYDDGLLREIVQEGIGRARRHGLTWESSLTAFVALLFEVAPDFDRHPSIARILQDERIPANHRVRALVDRIGEEEWEEAAGLGDPDRWLLPWREVDGR